MILLVAVQKRRSGIVCDKFNRGLTTGGHQDRVFQNASRRSGP